MTYKEIFADIYKTHRYRILLLVSAALIWSLFLFPADSRTAAADTLLHAPSALSLDSFGSSSADLATSLMEAIGVSADPYTVLTFIGTASRLNDHFGWNLNISPGLMKYDIIFIMVAILFAVTKISKCFGTTKALSMIQFGEIEKWIGFLFTALLSSSIFIDFVTSGSLAFAAGSSAVFVSTASNVLLAVLSFAVTLLSCAVYYLVKLFFDFLDVITLPLSIVPGATFLYEAVKTLGVLSVMLAIMFFPVIGLTLCILIVVTAAFFFKKSYTAMRYFKKVYFKPFFRGFIGYSKDIPLVHKKIPGKVKKRFPGAAITLALPVYNLQTLTAPHIKRYAKLWLVCADGCMYLYYPALKSGKDFLTLFTNEPEHPVFIKPSRRFYEIFCTPENEDMTLKFSKIKKEYHLVLSKEYTGRIQDILSACGYTEYIPNPYKKEKEP